MRDPREWLFDRYVKASDAGQWLYLVALIVLLLAVSAALAPALRWAFGG